MAKWEISNISVLVGLLVIKVMAFWEISTVGPALGIKIMSYVWPNGKFQIFPF